MIELEIYARGVRDMDKILELDHLLSALPGLRSKVDRNHDLVYLEVDEPVDVSAAQIEAAFRRAGLNPRFVGALPPELAPAG